MLPGVTYHWEFVKNNDQFINLGPELSVTINASAGLYTVDTHTLRIKSFVCGQYSTWQSQTVTISNCSSFRMASFPNPVSDELNISFMPDATNQMAKALEEPIQVTLIDSNQQPIYDCHTN